MANLLRATVSITGTRPLVFHHFGPHSIPLEKEERTGVAGNDPEEWKKTVVMTKDRELYLPPNYIFGMCRDGARYVKKGRSTIQTAVCASLLVDDGRIFITRDGEKLRVPEEPDTDTDLPVYLDICSVRNPTTKARNVRYRIGAAPGWGATFHFIWDKTVVSRAEMEQVIMEASRLVGLGDGRGIGNGRFTYSWSVEDC